MSRKRKLSNGSLEPGIFSIDSGTAELVQDRNYRDGWLLYVNGVQSSHIDLADTSHLDFEYMRYMALVIESHFNPSLKQKLNMLHLGGAACSLPRFLAERYPQARQVVVELDGKLAELARSWFDLPKAPRLRLRVGDAREVTESLRTATRDVIVRDVFSGAHTPRNLTTIEFALQIQRVLRPGGLYLINCGDGPQLGLARSEIVTLASVFKNIAVISDSAMLKGKRHGNIVLAASDQKIGSASLLRLLRADPLPAQLWNKEKALEFSQGVQPLLDADV
ncbi:MAG: fused MFS/spermidine synthase [Micrococcaceae bacterium]